MPAESANSDKTGTLTLNRMTAVQMVIAGARELTTELHRRVMGDSAR